jgi:hypothetical protein
MSSHSGVVTGGAVFSTHMYVTLIVGSQHTMVEISVNLDYDRPLFKSHLCHLWAS